METQSDQLHRQPRDPAWWAMSAGSIALFGWLVVRAARRAAERNTGDFIHFYEAARAVLAGADLYRSGTGGYIYPPLLAALVSPLARLSEVHAAQVWLAINATLTVVAMMIALRFIITQFAGPRVARPGPAVLLFSILLGLEQLRWELELGQTDSILLLAFAFAMAFGRSRPVATGILLGLAANIKYLTLISVPYFLFRRNYRAASATVISVLGWALAPALVLGWRTNLDGLERAVLGVGAAAGVIGERESGAADVAEPHTILWHRSISVTSAAARATNAMGLGIPAGIFLAALIAAVVAIASLRLYHRHGWSFLQGERRDSTDPRDVGRLDAIEWTGLIIAVLAFAPQTTTRHMYLLLIPYILIATVLLAPPRPRNGVDRRWVLAGVILFQLALRLPPSDMGMDRLIESWRHISGASWCLLAMFLLLLRGTLGAAAPSRSSS